MNYETILCEQKDGVATITLNRPNAKNALNTAMTDELCDALSTLRRDDSAQVLVLTGAGAAFCSGGDARQMGSSGERSIEQRRAAMQRYHDLTRTLYAFERPVIAAVDGVAYGAGFSLALLADLVLVSDRVRFAMVFHRIGLVPDLGAYYTLPRAVGLQRAKELILSAREFGAAEAIQMGLALEAVEAGALLPRAMELATSLVGAPPLAQTLSKSALRSSLNSDLATMLDLEASAQALAGSSAYTREAIRRFGAKEPPMFRWPVAAAS